MELNYQKDPTYQQLCAVSTTGEQEINTQDIVHYAFESVSQLEEVQEEVVLDNNNGLLLPAGESQFSCLVSTSNCNPVVRDDNQCVDMVLEEIITDTQHHVGEDNDDNEKEQMMMIMDMDDVIPATLPTALPPPSPKPLLTTLTSVPDISFDENNPFTAHNESARTQKPLSVSSSTSPIVKIVPTENSHKFVMKIQSKEPPDLSTTTQSAAAGESQCGRGGAQDLNNGIAMEEDEVDNDEEEEEEGEVVEEEETAATTRVNEVGKAVKVPREMKQLQKMVNSSKVLTDFMSSNASTPEIKGRKFRKAPGRPKKKVVDPSAAIVAVLATDHESPKRQSTRALAATEAAAAKKTSPDFMELFGSYLNQSNSVASETSGLNDAEELSMDYHSDNETNESVASGGTDTMQMKLPKVNSGNTNVSIEPAPKEGNDPFCWRCHMDAVQICCASCERSFHSRCFRLAQGSDWRCPDCVEVAAVVKNLGNNVCAATEKMCRLLTFAWQRITQLKRSTEIIDGFTAANYADFDRFVQHPIALQDIERKIQNNRYHTAEEFTADFKWLLHNCYVYFSNNIAPPAQSAAVLKIAKSLLKTCKQEMAQIETCSECYANANSKKNWFVEVCDPPHVLLWAKLKGFPYWPAKAMAFNNATLVDVRFFGAHDRAWVPVKDCYLYSQHNPNVYKVKNTSIMQCIKEIEQHIVKIKQKFGSFEYAPAKEKYDPLRHDDQLQVMLPGYNANKNLFTSSSKAPLAAPSIVAASASIVTSTAATTTPGTAASESPQEKKTNLTYKIIKTGDNSRLISPVVKAVPDKNGEAKGVVSAEPQAVSDEKKRKKSSPPPPVNSLPEEMPAATSTTREAIKPTKIVIKNSYDEKNKHYELVTPTEEQKPPEPEETRKVETVVVKRKSDKWRALSLKRTRTTATTTVTSTVAAATVSREASPKRETTATETPVNSASKDMKRRNTEEVTTTASAVPNKIKIRRVTRAASRPPQELKEEEAPASADSSHLHEPIVIVEEKDEVVEVKEAEVGSPPKPITTVKDVLDQLPQISIVPSRKNSISRPSDSRLSSRSSSKSSNKDAKEAPSTSLIKRTSQVDLQPILVPENLQVKIEPISDDEVEITVNGRDQSRERSVEIVEDVTGQRSKPVTPNQPRARKTFARNIGNRPKPPAFSTAQLNNMVLIPKELSVVDQVKNNISSGSGIAVPKTSAGSSRESPVHMLGGSITPNLAAAVTTLISHGPPRLVRKPSGTLQSSGDLIFPSEAGSSCRILMENAHKMTDFFRSVIEDTLSDMADKGCLEAKVQLLQLELEKQKYNHQKEVAELKSNTDLILCEMKNSLELEKTRAINDTRKQCEVERQQAIESTKKKQWCANCGKEAQFYCCWNTSYCDYPCQQKHWPRHVKTCAQAGQSPSKSSNSGDQNTARTGIAKGNNNPPTNVVAAERRQRPTPVINGRNAAQVVGNKTTMNRPAQKGPIYPGNINPGLQNNAAPNLGLAFSVANGVGGGQGMQRWGADTMSMFPTATTISAGGINALAGTSFLSNLGGITPITFANTTITAGRPGAPSSIDPMLVFSAESK